MPERVCELKELKEPRGMAFHKPTGTLLIACPDGMRGGEGAGVELLDTRPPPSQWLLSPSNRLPATSKGAGVEMPISIAIDEPNGFVYIATYDPQTVTQYKATVKTAAEKGRSTVDLKLTAVRQIDGVRYPPAAYGQLTAVAVLSPSTLLLLHMGRDRIIEVLTHGLCRRRSGQQIGRSGRSLASARPAAEG
jgi:hypothetical protein